MLISLASGDESIAGNAEGQGALGDALAVIYLVALQVVDKAATGRHLGQPWMEVYGERQRRSKEFGSSVAHAPVSSNDKASAPEAQSSVHQVKLVSRHCTLCIESKSGWRQ